jgi:hypothetical protein
VAGGCTASNGQGAWGQQTTQGAPTGDDGARACAQGKDNTRWKQAREGGGGHWSPNAQTQQGSVVCAAGNETWRRGANGGGGGEQASTTHRKNRAILDMKNTMAGVQAGQWEVTGAAVPVTRSSLHMSATGPLFRTPPCTYTVFPTTTIEGSSRYLEKREGRRERGGTEQRGCVMQTHPRTKPGVVCVHA